MGPGASALGTGCSGSTCLAGSSFPAPGTEATAAAPGGVPSGAGAGSPAGAGDGSGGSFSSLATAGASGAGGPPSRSLQNRTTPTRHRNEQDTTSPTLVSRDISLA